MAGHQRVERNKSHPVVHPNHEFFIAVPNYDLILDSTATRILDDAEG